MPEPFDQTDDVLARKLTEIAPPADLRARLLALEQTEEVEEVGVGGGWWTYRIIGMAAVLALALGVLSFWIGQRGEPISAATTDISKFLTNGFTLALKTNDISQVREWLVANNPTHTVALPPGLMQRTPIGCREMMWRGHAGSLACFTLKDGREAHLAMFPMGTFEDAPGGTPMIASAGKWIRAAWTRDGMTYLLFVPEGMDPMKVLAALAVDQRFWKIASSNARSTAWPAAKVSLGVARISSSLWT